MEDKVKNVERIFEFCRILNHKEDIKKYVEKPLVPICEYLFDLNIQKKWKVFFMRLE